MELIGYKLIKTKGESCYSKKQLLEDLVEEFSGEDPNPRSKVSGEFLDDNPDLDSTSYKKISKHKEKDSAQTPTFPVQQR